MNVSETKRGVVVWFNHKRGIGFVAPHPLSNRDEDNLFIHRRNFENHFLHLQFEDEVLFEIGEFNGRPCGINVRLTAPVAKESRQ